MLMGRIDRGEVAKSEFIELKRQKHIRDGGKEDDSSTDDSAMEADNSDLEKIIDQYEELREREESGRRLGVDTDGAGRLRGSGGRILIVDDNARQVQKMVDHLSAEHRPMVESDPAAAMIAARGMAGSRRSMAA